MAEAYICDVCGVTIKNPHEAHMREFFMGVSFVGGLFLKERMATPKRSIHLCGHCYRSFREIAERARRKDDDK
jgi:hypothetical protein